jgi:hypothetical protein
MNPSRLQSAAKHLKHEMDHAEAVRRAALDTESARKEARQCKNVHQEGALGALLQGYASKLLVCPAPTMSGLVVIRMHATSSLRIPGRRMTTSAPLFWQMSRPIHKLKLVVSVPGWW